MSRPRGKKCREIDLAASQASKVTARANVILVETVMHVQFRLDSGPNFTWNTSEQPGRLLISTRRKLWGTFRLPRFRHNRRAQKQSTAEPNYFISIEKPCERSIQMALVHGDSV